MSTASQPYYRDRHLRSLHPPNITSLDEAASRKRRAKRPPGDIRLGAVACERRIHPQRRRVMSQYLIVLDGTASPVTRTPATAGQCVWYGERSASWICILTERPGLKEWGFGIVSCARDPFGRGPGSGPVVVRPGVGARADLGDFNYRC